MRACKVRVKRWVKAQASGMKAFEMSPTKRVGLEGGRSGAGGCVVRYHINLCDIEPRNTAHYMAVNGAQIDDARLLCVND